MSKITTVKLDDGTIRKVCDDDLRRYLAEQNIKEICPVGIKPWEMKSIIDAYSQIRDQESSEIKSNNAKLPRNEFAREPAAKEKLDAFKNKFEFDNGSTHGWIKKACEEFLIDQKTLKKIIDK